MNSAVDFSNPAVTYQESPPRPRFYEAEARRRRLDGHIEANLVMRHLHSDLQHVDANPVYWHRREVAQTYGQALRIALVGLVARYAQQHINA